MDGYGLHFIDLSNHTTAFMQAASFNFFCFFSKNIIYQHAQQNDLDCGLWQFSC